ncbi:MAG TPA: MOSC N-terminal beta barrel domain-containing protein [Acidimicrobiales bacterium]|nr:MOSC N-terminal beta barrel domain-containing protein [Acidimicrobiales bacterium]
MTEQVIGRVAALWRYPVKSMYGEQLSAASVDHRGLAGDRAYAVVDVETGQVASAKRPRQWGGLMLYSSTVVDPAATPPAVRVTLSDGSAYLIGQGDDIAAEEALSAALGRRVRLVSTAPQGAELEEIWSEEKGDALYGPVVDREDDQPVIRYSPALGAPPGTLFDFSAVHLVTTSSLRSLGIDVDVRRFRPNLVIHTDADGFPENEWVGRSLRVGDSLTVEGLMLTMRCVMITLPQPDLSADRSVMRAVTANRVEVPGLGTYPCLGLYARVTEPGDIAAGDPVTLL